MQAHHWCQSHGDMQEAATASRHSRHKGSGGWLLLSSCSEPAPLAFKRYHDAKPLHVWAVLVCVVQKRAGAKGFGLFAAEDMKAGQFLIEYLGEALEEEEYHRRYE